ncbi:hypothetical protein IWX90DRAFT_240846 [Phyllosticta citrichinensis]|uniref:Uncharacterized protein n=1 Tax=Phyllosticta citrichinensis TaxID=1130410 RepID=A0ABR1XQB4_9PEZI
MGGGRTEGIGRRRRMMIPWFFVCVESFLFSSFYLAYNLLFHHPRLRLVPNYTQTTAPPRTHSFCNPAVLCFALLSSNRHYRIFISKRGAGSHGLLVNWIFSSRHSFLFPFFFLFLFFVSRPLILAAVFLIRSCNIHLVYVWSVARR